LGLAEVAVEKALRAGATEAEAYVSRSTEIKVDFSNSSGSDCNQSVKSTDLVGIGLRVILGKRIATFSTSIPEEKEIDRAASTAVKIARVSPEDPHWQHLNSEFGYSSASGFYDKTVENLENSEMIEEMNLALERVTEYDKRVKPMQSSLSRTLSRVSIANSSNMSNEFKETGIRFVVDVQARDGNLKSTGTAHCEKTYWKEVDVEIQADEAAKRAVEFLKAETMPNCKTSLIIRNQVFASILGIMLSGPINAEWVQKGRSILSGKMNARIASDKFNLVDDGLLHGGWATKPFDDEGHPTQKTQIVEDGILKNYLYDTYTALQANTNSTGNARRDSYSAPPTPAPSNLILKPGRTGFEAIIQETKNGIYIEETIGDWLSDPISGRLSATITHGHLVENGKLTKTIKGMVFSGDFYQILAKGIEAVGTDISNYGQIYSPSVKIAEITVAGKD
jgi:PmbA protein